jgi:hypothetical protein
LKWLSFESSSYYYLIPLSNLKNMGLVFINESYDNDKDL